MCSHDGCMFNAQNERYYLQLNDEDRFISFLPLNHIAAQYVDTMIPGRAARHAGGDAAQGATHLLRGGASRVREVHGGDPREERAELGLDCGEGET